MPNPRTVGREKNLAAAAAAAAVVEEEAAEARRLEEAEEAAEAEAQKNINVTATESAPSEWWVSEVARGLSLFASSEVRRCNCSLVV